MQYVQTPSVDCKLLHKNKLDIFAPTEYNISKRTPQKACLTALSENSFHTFRNIAQKFIGAQQAGQGISVQSDERSDCAAFAQSLCGVDRDKKLLITACIILQSCNRCNRIDIEL